MSEIIFEARKAELHAGYVATAIGFPLVARGETLARLRSKVRVATDRYFGGDATAPALIRLHFVRDELLRR